MMTNAKILNAIFRSLFVNEPILQISDICTIGNFEAFLSTIQILSYTNTSIRLKSVAIPGVKSLMPVTSENYTTSLTRSREKNPRV